MTCMSVLKKAGILLLIAMVCGCSTRTYVSATGSTPPQYTHVYLTINQVWLNASATAQPGDASWSKFTLSQPVTIDLVNSSNGALTRLIGSLRLTSGNYAQIRLIPVDTTSTLTDSAKLAGASFNNEVDYVDVVDTASVSHQLPLEILNPENGIGAQGDLQVPFGGAAAPVASTSTNSTDGTGNSTGINSGSTGLGLGTNSAPTVVNFAVNFNAATDIALFTYDSQLGAVLNSHAQAFDLARSGGISGTLTLTNLVNITNASARLNIVATAETISPDSSRHVVVINAPVRADGTFLLYPLPANDSTNNPTTYDVVIHGAGIETMIIKGVQVKRDGTSASASTSSSTSSTTTASTTTVLTTGTAATSVGTLIPLPATPYAINLDPTTTLPAGSIVSLYQTLPGTGEIPYVIEQSVIDPFNIVMQTNLMASSGVVQTGSYVVDGTAITLTNVTPVEGTGSYSVAASASFFNDGTFTAVAPASGNTTLVKPAPLVMVTNASNDSASLIITHSSVGSYNRGQLIVSRDGSIVATSSLDIALTNATGGNVIVNGLPGGHSTASFATGIYDVSVRVWNSQDPAGTLQRQTFPAAIDVRNGSVTNVPIAIN